MHKLTINEPLRFNVSRAMFVALVNFRSGGTFLFINYVVHEVSNLTLYV